MSDLTRIPVPGTTSALDATLIDGQPFVALKPMCEALGIDAWTQQEKLNAKSWATTRMSPVVAADM